MGWSPAYSERSGAPRSASIRPRGAASCGLPIEPGGGEAAAVVEAEVGPVVLEGAVPDRDVDAARHVHVVLLHGQVALDLVDDLAPGLEVGGAPLADEEIVQD